MVHFLTSAIGVNPIGMKPVHSVGYSIGRTILHWLALCYEGQEINACDEASCSESGLLTSYRTKKKNSTTGADASGELLQLAEELANCNAVVCSY